jgi:hypothetical protein
MHGRMKHRSRRVMVCPAVIRQRIDSEGVEFADWNVDLVAPVLLLCDVSHLDPASVRKCEVVVGRPVIGLEDANIRMKQHRWISTDGCQKVWRSEFGKMARRSIAMMQSGGSNQKQVVACQAVIASHQISRPCRWSDSSDKEQHRVQEDTRRGIIKVCAIA